MDISVKNREKWQFPNEWLEALEAEFYKQLPDKKILLVIEDIEQKDYIVRIDGNNGNISVYISACKCMKNDMTSIFKKGYLKALVEHEIKHLQPHIVFNINQIVAPFAVLNTESKEFYDNLERRLNLKFQDFLRDIYANSGMTVECCVGFHQRSIIAWRL